MKSKLIYRQIKQDLAQRLKVAKAYNYENTPLVEKENKIKSISEKISFSNSSCLGSIVNKVSGAQTHPVEKSNSNEIDFVLNKNNMDAL